MLRTAVKSSSSATGELTEARWRVSAGTAGVLGLLDIQQHAPPTTAYLMLGERCSRNCAFCTQARESRSPADTLSRVTWPDFASHAVVEAIERAFQQGKVQRACFQVTVCPGYLEETERAVRELARHCRIPICASVAPRDAADVGALLAAGAERVTIALDAASERVYREMKGGSWAATMALLESCARLYPGHVGTHLIIGLGETEREAVELMQWLRDLGVGIGLFSFTPASGTALAGREPPPLRKYRRMQAARWLICNNLARGEQFEYDGQTGELAHYGLPETRLRALLADGEAFRTAGCTGCNRPYYNERPGGVMYNYPRPLTLEEASREAEALVAGLRECLRP